MNIIKNPTRRIWVISDLHMGHENILTFKDSSGNLIRPFKSVDEMDECIIDSWNSVVRQGDIVYNLGDVFFGDYERFKRKHAKLNGSKRLLIGNHDNVKLLSSSGLFGKVQLWRNFHEERILLTHVPVHESCLDRREEQYANVHGHVHQNTLDNPLYKNMSCEAVNYTPVELGTLSLT